MWKFDQTPNCAPMMSRSVVHDGHPIFFVYHDEEDHGWQFLDGATPPLGGLTVCLSQAVELISYVEQIADLPSDWIAWRESADDAWLREPHDAYSEE
jgi:hypothetical protein